MRVVRDAFRTSNKCLHCEPSVWNQSREKNENEREQTEWYERGGVCKTQRKDSEGWERREALRRSRPPHSLFMDLNQPWDWPGIPNTDPSPYLLQPFHFLMGSPHLFIPALLIPTEQVSQATPQEVRGQVCSRVGWVGVWTWVHLDEWPDIIRYQSYTTSGVRDRAREF